MRKNKLQKLLSKLNGIDEKTSENFKAFDNGVAKLKEELRKKIQVNTLDEVNEKIDKFRTKIDLEPLLETIGNLRNDFVETIEQLVEHLDVKSVELTELSKNTGKEISDKIPSLISDIDGLKNEISSLIEEKAKDLVEIKDQIEKSKFNESGLLKKIDDLEKKIDENDKVVSETEDELEKEIDDLKNTIEKNRKDLLSMIASKGGGSMNRKETFGGVDYLTRYTDINWKAGQNVSFTVANNNQTKMVDVTITATSTGSGRVRLIQSINTATVAGNDPDTDYVYLCSGTFPLTLPTAVGNDNLYTIKNVGTGVITVDTTSSQTIDGDLTIIMPVQYTSVDLISDTANWNIT